MSTEETATRDQQTHTAFRRTPLPTVAFPRVSPSRSHYTESTMWSIEPGSFTSNGSMIVVSNRLPFVLKRNELTGQLERKAR